MNTELIEGLRSSGPDYVGILINIYTLGIYLIQKLIYWLKLNKFIFKSYFIDSILDIGFVFLSGLFVLLSNLAFKEKNDFVIVILLIIIFIITPIIYFKKKRNLLLKFGIKSRNYYWIYDILIIFIALAYMYYYKYSLWN